MDDPHVADPHDLDQPTGLTATIPNRRDGLLPETVTAGWTTLSLGSDLDGVAVEISDVRVVNASTPRMRAPT